MTKLRETFDPRAFELLRRVEADPDAASEVLALVVVYLRERKSLPGMLADYIADAFELAVAKPKELRAKQLTDELNLTANNKRKVAVTWLDAYEIIKQNEGKSINALSEKLGKTFNIGTETARIRIKEAMKYIEDNE